MEKIKGTYELVSYTRTMSNGEEKDYTQIDWKEKHKIVSYLVITGEETGYYAYADNMTFPKAIKEPLTYKMTDTGDCEYIEYYHKDQAHTCSLTVSKDKLVEGTGAWYGCHLKLEQDGYKREWKKVSDAVDLSYVISKMGEDLALPSGYKE